MGQGDALAAVPMIETDAQSDADADSPEPVRELHQEIAACYVREARRHLQFLADPWTQARVRELMARGVSEDVAYERLWHGWRRA